jgi:hypothetical protein
MSMLAGASAALTGIDVENPKARLNAALEIIHSALDRSRRRLVGVVSSGAERALRFAAHTPRHAGGLFDGRLLRYATEESYMINARLAAPAFVAVTLGLAACGGSATPSTVSSRPTTLYTVSMTGAAETPKGAPHGRGVAIIACHGASKVCFRFSHLHGFVDATVAHIHSGSTGHSGPVLVALSSRPKLHHHGCLAISPTVSRTIWKRPSAYYVNVHSRRYPGGAVRAQL